MGEMDGHAWCSTKDGDDGAPPPPHSPTHHQGIRNKSQRTKSHMIIRCFARLIIIIIVYAASLR